MELDTARVGSVGTVGGVSLAILRQRRVSVVSRKACVQG